MITSWVQGIISYHSNLLEWCIYFWTFLNTIKLFSSVKLSDPNNKFSIEITVYGVILIINCRVIFNVFVNVQKYIHHSNRFEWYEIIPCTQDVIIYLHSIPLFPPFFPITSVYQIYSCIHLLYYVTCCHFLIYVYNIIV
jgi:hypothetical protein